MRLSNMDPWFSLFDASDARGFPSAPPPQISESGFGSGLRFGGSVSPLPSDLLNARLI